MQSIESCCNSIFLFEAQHNLSGNETNNKCLSVSNALNYSNSAYAANHVFILSLLISGSHAVHANAAQKPKNIKASPFLSLVCVNSDMINSLGNRGLFFLIQRVHFSYL